MLPSTTYGKLIERGDFVKGKQISEECRSDAAESLHEAMEALHDVGVIDKPTMRRFDDACLTPVRASMRE
jgi:hypothetical protein